MELNKLENTFRNKLNNREINPSTNSWDRLDAMLTVTEKPKSSYKWHYFAASLIGFLWIETVFFNQNQNIIDVKRNFVVIEKETQKASSKTEIKALKIEVNHIQKVLKQERQPWVQTQKNIKINSEERIIKNQKEVIAEIQPIEKNDPIALKEKSIQINIDDLLASAEKNSKVNSKKSSIKINSNALLEQVDGELQLSFREKALNTITKKYKEAKEALANRNNQ